MRVRWVAAFAWLSVLGLALGYLPVREAVSVANAQWVTVSERKVCGACNREVPLSSRPGMRCPHCRVYWAHEKTIRSYTTEVDEMYGPRAPRRAGATVTIRHGDETYSVPAKTIGGTLLVPVKAFEKLGAVVEKTHDGIVIGLDEAVLRLWPGKQAYEVAEGAALAGPASRRLPVAPRMVRGNLYVPLRAIAEALGFSVSWEPGVLTVE